MKILKLNIGKMIFQAPPKGVKPTNLPDTGWTLTTEMWLTLNEQAHTQGNKSGSNLVSQVFIPNRTGLMKRVTLKSFITGLSLIGLQDNKNGRK